MKQLLDLEQNLFLWQLFSLDKAMNLDDKVIELGDLWFEDKSRGSWSTGEQLVNEEAYI